MRLKIKYLGKRNFEVLIQSFDLEVLFGTYLIVSYEVRPGESLILLGWQYMSFSFVK